MFRALKWAAPVVAFGLLFSLAGTRASAADAPAASGDKGTVSGTVTDKDGKPVANCPVRLFHPMDHAGGGKKGGGEHGDADKGTDKKADKDAAGTDRKATQLADKPAKGDKPVPVASGTTDSDGKFTLNDVPVGDYMVIANLKGTGSAREKVTVKSGETATVSLKLEYHDKGAGKGGSSAGTGSSTGTGHGPGKHDDSDSSK